MALFSMLPSLHIPRQPTCCCARVTKSGPVSNAIQLSFIDTNIDSDTVSKTYKYTSIGSKPDTRLTLHVKTTYSHHYTHYQANYNQSNYNSKLILGYIL